MFHANLSNCSLYVSHDTAETIDLIHVNTAPAHLLVNMLKSVIHQHTYGIVDWIVALPF